MTEVKHPEEDGDDVDSDYDPEKEVIGNWKIKDLPEIPVVTGEEDEETIVKMKSKIYRWRGEWKERGVGELKLLKHKKSNLIRILVRAEKTHKCIANHLLQTKGLFCKLQKMNTSNNAWTWAAYDISDEKPETEKFCAKFTSKQDFESFQVNFEKACEHNGAIIEAEKAKEAAEEKKQEKEVKQEKKEEEKKEEAK